MIFFENALYLLRIDFLYVTFGLAWMPFEMFFYNNCVNLVIVAFLDSH